MNTRFYNKRLTSGKLIYIFQAFTFFQHSYKIGINHSQVNVAGENAFFLSVPVSNFEQNHRSHFQNAIFIGIYYYIVCTQYMQQNKILKHIQNAIFKQTIQPVCNNNHCHGDTLNKSAMMHFAVVAMNQYLNDFLGYSSALSVTHS